jgi:signal transduction histidine kinase
MTTSSYPKILYIDDDPLNRLLINRVLSNYQFEVIEAASGLEGLNLARQEPPQLILMDINMPGLDGHETTTRMRSIPTLAKIPIVAITARTTAGERELALAAGCDGYIPKPIDVDDFPQRILSYLDGKRDTLTSDERQEFLGHYSHKLVERLESKVLELEEANNRLQKIDKLKSDFITLAAHELRTPITLVYGYARLLQMMTQDTGATDSAEEDVANVSNRIFQSVHRLNEVVNDILNIALIQADEMRLMQEPVNLAEVIDAARQELDPVKNDRNLEILSEGLSDLPILIGDRERLQQAFNNILSNAIKYTPDGGVITIKGWLTLDKQAQPGRPQQNRSLLDQEGIIILVQDLGVGLDPVEQSEIFEQFYIVGNVAYHSSSKTAFDGGGLGLGLPIARGIIEAHGGRIWVESSGRNASVDPGSKFYIVFPLRASGKGSKRGHSTPYTAAN